MNPKPELSPGPNRRRRWFFPRSTVAQIVVAVTLVVVIALIWRPPFMEFLELKLYDAKFRYRGSRPAGGEVVIVGIDDASLKQVGRWPWPREAFGELLQRVKDAGPRVIALDIIFAEKEETATVTAIKNLRRGISQVGGASAPIMALLEREEKRADVDRRLARIIAAGPPTILGFFFKGVGGRTPEVDLAKLMGPKVIQASSYNAVRWLEQKPQRLPVMGAEGVELNLPEITRAAAGGGYFNMVPDMDGTVRWLPLTLVYGPDFFAPLSLVAAQHYLGRPSLGLTMSRLGVDGIRLGKRPIPVDHFGRLLINYLGPPGIITTHSAAALMAGKLPEGALQDKVVLLGATAVGIYDLRVTPFSGVCPGIEIQGTIMDNILRGDFLKRPGIAPFPGLVAVLLLGLLLGVVLPRLSAVWAFIFASCLLGGYAAANYLLFRYGGWQLELLYPLLEITGVYTGITAQRFLSEERERARLKKAFQSYVAPEVVNQIIKHPERLRLGGERRELTILFSDIRGFTTISETLEPEALVEVLHEFLNPMSEIIVQNGGTIDKYMGDAIMAEFGAPLDLPDHAARACRTALKMVETLRDLDKKWAAQGRPGLRVGVGINTGPVAVGNMGSERLFDYTVIGDNVNLASRLEGLNKYYGTEILITAATAQALSGQFILKEVDLVKVKGKTQPIAIHELLGEGPADPDLARFLEIYHQGLSLFRDRRWQESAAAFTAALELRPQDVHLRNYLELAEKHRTTPPAPDWAPVTAMDQK
ncbi:MAG: adenylate/guanylate cyclase domain-containing protein [Thermodesulfobacteriota bacterium]